MSRPNLARRVTDAAEGALARQKYVTFVDVLGGLGWVRSRDVDLWRQGRAGTLEELAPVDGERMGAALDALRRWAVGQGLSGVETPYIGASRGRRELRFTVDGEPGVERACRTHWVSPALGERGRQSMAKIPDLTVVTPLNAWTCAGCGDTGPYLIMEDVEPYCLTCADMDHLVFLPSGDAALSRRAKKESGLCAIVVQFNRRRKMYQRRGILVEEAALARAEEQCLADEDARQRRRERDRVRRADEDVEFVARMSVEIRRLFPGCPVERADEIAGHAGLRGSGRVGRSAAARVLDENAITLAVIASIRHLDTDYDKLLMTGTPRMEARERIRAAIDRKLAQFRETA
ncbi:DUF2293 domain-containing protein [Spongiactinospora sp. TRM90649]|uniref:DUF2293 domain-containing protein n=1 Tax=Spongiactinospora sp. TRM90649 TaxID=3031114 RepID=UPI0023F66F8C|nr:DUF2293 domain-containing protein [Spongiactinospora sp. TRM90649]MDF5756473.1 DUF2293 domain-containing protein [Spongiactinospora sp. TRM90649]